MLPTTTAWWAWNALSTWHTLTVNSQAGLRREGHSTDWKPRPEVKHGNLLDDKAGTDSPPASLALDSIFFSTALGCFSIS